MINNWFKAIAFGLACVSTGLVYGGQARTLATSVRALGPDDAVEAVRSVTSADLAETMPFTMSLAMPNLAELRERLAAGDNLANGKLTRAEFEARYLPSVQDYDQMVAWLTAQGFTIVQQDNNHTTVTAEGPVSLVARALSVAFARVTTEDGEFTSAMSAPVLPAALPAGILGVDGLQPHIRAHHRLRTIRRATLSSKTGTYIGPAEIRAAYGATSAMTGAGQTIAIINDAYASATDLALFWSAAGITTQTIANVTNVAVNNGPPTSPDSGSVEESNLDVSYASAIAPSVLIRVYGIRSLSFNNVNTAVVKVLNDHASFPSMNVISMSFGGNEDSMSAGSISTVSQTFAQMAAYGVTALNASGDSGSRPDPSLVNFGYEVNDALSAGYPASDPSVTGVGGTTVNLGGAIGSTLTFSSETTWSEIPANPTPNSNSYGASGGGLSTYFTKPSWQSDGNALLAGKTVRCIPDVAAISVGGYKGSEIPVEIFYAGTDEGVEGTSLACPVWAAVVAIINQGRAANSESAIGFLNAAIYPIAGSGSFRDITTGSNGSDGNYTAQVGYDLTTGLGAPNLPTLLAVLAGVAPTITGQPSSTSVQEQTSASFTIGAGGSPSPTYQWQREPNGTSSFSNLADASGVYTGTATSTLTIVSPTTAMSGDQFRCIVTNALGSLTSSAATLTVTAKPVVVASGGGGGGGGAVSAWFLAALALLAGGRIAFRRRLA